MHGPLPPVANGQFLQPSDRQEQVYTLISFWLAGFIYGLYVILFFAAIYLTSRKRGSRTAVSVTFYISMYIMFAMATTYTFINIYRFVQAYASGDTFMQPIYYFRNFPSWHWDNFTYVIVVTSLILYADALVIYRCFIIWECNYLVVAVPTLLLAASIGINAVAVFSFARPDVLSWPQVVIFLNLIYPANLAQNILTTGLIAYRIWKQHRMSRGAGVYLASSWNLLTILRIIIESALVYTVQQVILLILYFMRHPAQVIIHETLVPSIGIVFVLIAVRTHMVVSESGNDWPLQSSFMIPGWSEVDDSQTGLRPSSSAPITPSSAYTNFPDLPFLRKDEEIALGMGLGGGIGRGEGLSLMEILHDTEKERDVEDRRRLETPMIQHHSNV